MTSEYIDYIAEAIKDSFGDRCHEHSDGCPTCEAWKQYDDLCAVPDVPELVAVSHEVFYAPTREWRRTVEPEYYRKNGDLVRDLIDKSKAAAMLAAKDNLISGLNDELQFMRKAAKENRQRAEASEAELAQIKALLKDHNAVHIALLRGDIAKPTAKQINHVYAAPIDQTAEVERLRSIVLSLCDHMEMVNSDLFDRTKSQQNPNISSMRIAIDEARIALSGKESK